MALQRYRRRPLGSTTEPPPTTAPRAPTYTPPRPPAPPPGPATGPQPWARYYAQNNVGPQPWAQYYAQPAAPDPASEARYTQNYYGQNRTMYETPEDLALRHRGTMIPTLVPTNPTGAVPARGYYLEGETHRAVYGTPAPYQAGQGWQAGQPVNAMAKDQAAMAAKYSLHSRTGPSGPQPPGVVYIPPEQTVQMGYPNGMIEPPPAAPGYGGYGYSYPSYGGYGSSSGQKSAGGRAPGVRPAYGQSTRPAGYSAPRYAQNMQAGRGGMPQAQAPRWYQELVSWRGV